MVPNRRTVHSVVCLIFLAIMIVATKPKIMYSADGRFKEFGVGSEQTIFSIGFVLLLGAVIFFYFFSVMDMIFGNV